MSGFITIYNTNQEPVDRSLIYSLTQTLKSRGPDRQDVWVDGEIGMGHALFKTTFEAEYENQPATIDNKVWITCSARIDDRENLVNKMGMKKEINLTRTPDSELILHAYRKWGENCLIHLLGDFAFIIWDDREKKLFCARDRFGMRQLYYTKKDHSFIACNSLDSILKHPSMTKELNDKAIGGFLLLGDHERLDPSLTAFKDVDALKPSHSLTLKNGKISLKKYWDIPLNIPLLHYKKEEDYIEHFLEIFKTAVSDRIRNSSVTIAMSGGMDSTAIAALIKNLQSNQSFKAHAITGIYKKLIPDNESYYASLVAKHINLPIDFINGDEFSFIKSKLITTSPRQIISPDFWFEMRKQALKYSRITLTGYAGDSVLNFSTVKTVLEEVNLFTVLVELIKSYYRYDKVPPLGFGIMTKIKQMTRQKEDEQTLGYPSWITPEFERKIALRELWEEYIQELPDTHIRYSKSYEALQSANWNVDDELFSTPLTLPEIRDPFLDTRVIEFIFSIPQLPWLFNKHIIRSSMKSFLPNEVINRPKTLLGNMGYAYLKQPKNKWVDSWKPVPELSNYINLKKLPHIAGGVTGKIGSHLNLRPIYLNTWIDKITQLDD